MVPGYKGKVRQEDPIAHSQPGESSPISVPERKTDILHSYSPDSCSTVAVACRLPCGNFRSSGFFEVSIQMSKKIEPSEMEFVTKINQKIGQRDQLEEKLKKAIQELKVIEEKIDEDRNFKKTLDAFAT